MASIQQFLSQNFGHAGTLVLIFGSIYGTFVVCDNNLSPRAKQDYANILTTKKYEILIASLPSLLTTMFENFLTTPFVVEMLSTIGICVYYCASDIATPRIITFGPYLVDCCCTQ